MMFGIRSVGSEPRHVASGGSVWIPPERVTRKFSLKLILHCSVIVVLLFMLALLAMQMRHDHSSLANRTSDLGQAYLKDYGYKDIELLKGNVAKVTVAESGVRKEVKWVEYKGVQIFYEDFEQLENKMIEADTGTYEPLKILENFSWE